jgi:hypothetical protein
LGELGRVGHALCECGPWIDGLNGSVRVGAGFFGRDKRPPDLRVQEHLVVDRFPLLLELLLLLVLGALNTLTMIRSCKSINSSMTVAMPLFGSRWRAE